MFIIIIFLRSRFRVIKYNIRWTYHSTPMYIIYIIIYDIYTYFGFWRLLLGMGAPYPAFQKMFF